MMFLKNNEQVPMTRRYPDLPGKVLRRDANIVKRLIDIGEDGRNDQAVFDLFKKENKNLSDERYWELLRSVWILSGNMERLQQFIEWFKSQRKQRFYFSTPEESKRLREFSYPITVYRATNNAVDNGLSWTLDLAYAERYKVMFDKSEIITRVVNSKSEVFALIERNKEEEILIIN